jgi:DNA-binding transcriptional LysR family regulator
MVLFASPRYLAARGTPRTAADLGSHEWVVFRGGPRKLRLDGPRGAVEVVPDGRVVCDDLLFLRDAVRAGAGIGLLPAALAEPEVAAGDLVRVLPRFRRAVGHLYIVCPAARHVPRKVVAFRDLVIERISSGWLP